MAKKHPVIFNANLKYCNYRRNIKLTGGAGLLYKQSEDDFDRLNQGEGTLNGTKELLVNRDEMLECWTTRPNSNIKHILKPTRDWVEDLLSSYEWEK